MFVMAVKIQIIGSALVCTDTITDNILISQPSRDVWYKQNDLQELERISFYDSNGIKGSEIYTDEMPTIQLADAVNENDIPFNHVSFREFATNFLGFDSSPQKAWARYDDGVYTSANKLTLVVDTEIVIPNNASNIVKSNNQIEFYNPSTLKVLADRENDLYLMTLVFKFSSSNANQTYLDINFQGENGTPYDRLSDTISFPKGNNVEHNYHGIFQYYADANFVQNGSQWKITSKGGNSSVWDIIFFISKV
jgi:hypothetical protein